MGWRGLSVGLGVMIAMAGVGFALVLDGFVSIPAGHIGVIYDRGRGVLTERAFEPGLHLKIPFWQQVTIMETRLQTYTMSQNLSQSDLINNSRAAVSESYALSESELLAQAPKDMSNSVDALTQDGQRVTVDLSIQYHVEGMKAPTLYNEVGLEYLNKIIIPTARSVTRERITGFESKELFNEETRQALENQIEETISGLFEPRNIALDDVLIRHVGFSEVYLNAIEEKQIAEQKIEKAEFERQEAEIRKETTIIQAEAEAESIRLKGESLQQSPEVIQLQFVEKMSPQVNWGILPDGALPLLDVSTLARPGE